MIERFLEEDRLNMSNVILVLSGSRALRRLKHLLLEKVQDLIDRSMVRSNWYPPVFLTVGSFPEELYHCKRPMACSITQQFTWIQAIEAIRKEASSAMELVFGHDFPEELSGRLELSSLFTKLHHELAAEGKNFKTVIQSLREKGITDEIHRWEILDRIQNKYFEFLDTTGFWDIQNARIFAVQHNKCHTDKEIILIGTSDLNEIQKQMLDAVSDHVTALVFAEESEKDHFDRFGCIIPEFWQETKIVLPDDQIFQTGNPQEQAVRIIELLRRKIGLAPDEPFPANIDWNDFSIGTPDGEVVPFLEQRLEALGISASFAAGVAKSRVPNRVILLADLIAVFLRSRRFSDYTALIRHPDFERWLLRKLKDSPLQNLPPDSQADSTVNDVPNNCVPDDYVPDDCVPDDCVPDDYGFEGDLPFSAEDLSEDGLARQQERKNGSKDSTASMASMAGEWLASFDRYQNLYLPELAEGNWNLREIEKSGIRVDLIGAVNAAVDELLAPFRPENDKPLVQEFEVLHGRKKKDSALSESDRKNDSEFIPEEMPKQLGEIFSEVPNIKRFLNEKQLPVPDWCSIISDLFSEIYSENDSSEDELEIFQIETGFDALKGCLDNLDSIPKNFCPPLGGSLVFSLLVRELRSVQIQTRPHQDGLELVGWLDLLLDDAPNIIICGMNEGHVPSMVSDDLFFPDSLRQSLDLNDNRRRAARDCYELSAVFHSHPDLEVTFGKRSLSGDSLLPGRFLFTGDEEEIAQRVCRFFDVSRTNESVFDKENVLGKEKALEDRQIVRQEKTRRSGFRPPVIHPTGACPTSMRVTEFSDFLACPYRYFLRHQLKLEHLTDEDLELSAASFGSIVHEILQKFGEDRTLHQRKDADALYQALSEKLDHFVHGVYPKDTSPMVPIQAEQIRSRLRAFAEWQISWERLGNEIKFVEKMPRRAVSLDVDGEKMILHGRIDRIDYNPSLNAWFVFDYKTFENYNTANRKKGLEKSGLPEQYGKYYTCIPGNTTDKKHRSKIQKALTGAQSITDKMVRSEKTRRSSQMRWINLQLPLYRHLLRQILWEEGASEPESVHIGYLVLPSGKPVMGLGGAWSNDELDDADDTARYVIRTIRRLWREGVDPDRLIDVEHPEWGTLLAEKSPPFTELFAPITCENQFIN